MDHLQFHRLLYRSPEGVTEVFEGEVVGIGKVAIKIMICRDSQELERK